MTRFVVGMAAVFFVFSGIHIYQVTRFIQMEDGQNIRSVIQAEIARPTGQAPTTNEITEHSLLLLEAEALDRRYHQGGGLLMSRIWSRLNAGGEAELRRQIASCSGPARTMPSSTQPNAPPDVNEVSTHYQAVGVSGSMKGGGNRHWSNESAAAASPIPPAELAARLVTVNQPGMALQGALRRLPATARGATVEGFAVAAVDGSPLQAQRTGACLKQYADPLKQEFQIASLQYMVTAYSVPDDSAVYQYAQKLHGLDLPIGVIAYSVPADMSLVSTDKGSICGSMAHELVHLLIRQSFPGAPAWLEEGLASEVAIAAPTPQSLRFGWSWRDQKLQIHDNEIPTVSDLLKMPWSALSAYHESEAWDVEANQAMVAVFIRYLDYRGKLRAIYFRARDQHVSADLSSVTSYDAIVEQELGMPVSEIDADFKSWFAAQGAQHPLAGFGSTESDSPAGATHTTTGGALNRACACLTECRTWMHRTAQCVA